MPIGTAKEAFIPPSDEEINPQLKLLAVYRETLAILLTQEAKSGVHPPVDVVHGIREARENIRRTKTMLREWGVSVPDLPDDEEPIVESDFWKRPARILLLLVLILLVIFLGYRLTSGSTSPIIPQPTEIIIGNNAIVSSIASSTTPIAVPPTTVPTDTPLPDPVCVAARDLNLRIGPGTNFGVIRILSKDTVLKPVARDTSNDWINVEVDTGTGWVSISLVDCRNLNIEILGTQIVPSPAPTNIPPPPTDTPIQVVNAPGAAAPSLPASTTLPPTNIPIPTDTPLPATDTPIPTDTPLPPSPPIPISSHFDSGTLEEWSLAPGGQLDTPASGGSGSTQRTSNGYLSWVEHKQDGSTSYYVAPEKFYRDWTDYSTLQFNLKSSGGTKEHKSGADMHSDIYLENNDKMTAQFSLPHRPRSNWETFTISLTDDSGWKFGGGAKTLADVLKNVTVFQIRAEYAVGEDQSGLDNVMLIP